MRISDWSSDVCSSDLPDRLRNRVVEIGTRPLQQHAQQIDPQRQIEQGGDQEQHRVGGVGAHQISFAREAPSSRPRAAAACSASSKIVRSPDISSRSDEHTSELTPLMSISYAVFCLKN